MRRVYTIGYFYTLSWHISGTVCELFLLYWDFLKELLRITKK